MANRLDVVAVWTNHESGVVILVVIWTQAWCAVVSATRLKRCAIECFDLLAILGRERQVKMRRLLFGLIQAN